MTGEMSYIHPTMATEPDGTCWPIHAAIARAVGGIVQPFDQYQGPYVLVDTELRVGNPPYDMPIPRAIRLWIVGDGDGSAYVYREDTGLTSDSFPEEILEAAVDAALSLMEDN